MEQLTKAEIKLAKDVGVWFVQSLINSGDINPEGKTSAEIIEEAKACLAILKSANIEWPIAVDYTDDLLKRARLFNRTDRKELACLFYALWIEHQLNKFMSILAERKRIPNRNIEALIRDTPYRAKCSWLLQLFGITPIPTSHINVIGKLMDLRNAYVHYKWKPEREEASRELLALLERIEKTVRYLRYFEAKHLKQITTRRVKKLLSHRV